MSALLNFGSISALGPLSLFPSVLVLLLIVLVGILFDLVGTAATAARADAFAAMASQRIAGSREALRIVHAADSVASFCNDVVGDICGTLSGAVVATIVFQVASGISQVSSDVVNTTLLALTAAVTVSGKALGKGIAIHNYVGVLMVVGRIVHFVESTLGLGALVRFFSRRKKAGRKGKSRNDRSPGRK